MAGRSSKHHTTSRSLDETLCTYEKDADVFLKHWGRKRYKPPPLLSEWLLLLPGQAVLLDLGCGAGQDARYLSKLGHRVIGLDRTMPLLQFAKRRARSVPFLLADMRALPIRSGRLHGIWTAASLIHLPKREVARVLAALRQLLKPQGLLAGTFIYGSNSCMNRTGWMPGRYFARWKIDELARTLRKAGWEVLSIRVVSDQERKGRWGNVTAAAGHGSNQLADKSTSEGIKL